MILGVAVVSLTGSVPWGPSRNFGKLSTLEFLRRTVAGDADRRGHSVLGVLPK
jgi:hypothetical protein